MRPYAAAEGTPDAEIREVKATAEGRIVQVTMAETAQTTRTAFLGCPLLVTCDTQFEYGRIPSRATAKTKRDAASMAITVFCGEIVRLQLLLYGNHIQLTSHKVTVQTIVMNI